MIKVLIVDDERWVRKSIIGKADWETLGAEVIGEASNGLNALDFVEKFSPNIVITDMLMPDMDGVELIRTLREKHPFIKIVIISGYSDFEYTKQALKSKVEDYILKPIEEKDLNDCLKKTINSIYSEEKERNEMLDIKAKAKERENTLSEIFLNKIVFDKMLTGSALKEGCRKNSINLNFEYYSVCCFNISSPNKITSDISNYGSEILYILNTTFSSDNGICFHNLQKTQEYICIIGDCNKDFDTKTLHNCKKAVDELDNKFDIYCSCGIGKKYKGLESINKSYLEAANASRFINLKSNKKVMYICDIDSIPPYDFLHNINDKKEILFHAVESGNLKEINIVIDNIFDSIRECQIVNMDEIQLFCINLLISIRENINQAYLNSKEIFPDNISFSKSIQSYVTLEAIQCYLKDTLHGISQNYLMTLGNNVEAIVFRAKEYISINFYKKLCLDDMSNMFHLSNVYFSKVFKHYTGQNFIQFLTSVRMQKANEYLQNSSIKISDVASMVGYDDYRHFSKLYKKYYNYLPSDTRNRQTGAN